MSKRLLSAILFSIAIPFLLNAQVTTSSISGRIKSSAGEGLTGASISATHEPTGTLYTTLTRNGGYYEIANVNPGGPYRIEVSFVGFDKLTRQNVFIALGENSNQDFIMSTQAQQLSEVVIASTRARTGALGGAETNVGRDKMATLPTVGRNVQDFLRLVPQVKSLGGNDGGFSIAGQNNRYNSFYIDGAVNNDVFGLAASGTNGGQAGIPPISIDAIDQFHVVISPYDASLGNFTGGGVNAITRSGTNKLEGSAYYFFTDEQLTGKTPYGSKSSATRLAEFSNDTYGLRVGGPIVKNKLFFFINLEHQGDESPQPFSGAYNGTSSISDINNLASVLKNTYKYDPGDYVNNIQELNSNRIVAKVDWNMNPKNKFSFSYRYNNGERYNVSRSSSSTINFTNNGVFFPSLTNSGSAEWNSRFKRNANNKLLLTFTKVNDDRGAIGDAFPRVTINDGAGRIIFGTEEFSTGNQLKQNNYALFDVFKFYAGKHTLSVGTDNELSKSYNIFIRQNYGSYTFGSLSDFLNNMPASSYNRTYSLLDPGVTGDKSVNAAAEFKTLRLAFFANDEIKLSSNLTMSFGIRVDNTNFLTTPKTDHFFNDTALSKLSAYYDMKGARSGQIADPKWSVSPRFGFVYRVPDEGITVRGGAGLFTGRVPLVWPGGVYNNNGISLAGISRSNVLFREDPFGQYVASDFGLTVPVPSGQVDLIAKNFKMNKVFRTSLAMDKSFANNWKITVEAIYTKNINEIDYQRVDILPPVGKTIGADVRNVYGLSGSFPSQIGLRSNGSNPYTGIYLLSNNEGDKGSSFNVSLIIDKAMRNGFAFNATYTYGHSIVRNEGTSSQNNSQWRFMETIQGRNFLPLSTSDYDLGHRITAFVSKKFTYANKVLATTISLFYNGQSGSPFSYTMTRGLIRDYDNNETNDLIYVPRYSSEIVFLQNGSLSPADQWTLFNAYIENDKYLSQRRGMYAERNGARLPFTHIIDLKLAQDFNVRIGGREYQIQLTYDVFNFTNMLNRKWGRSYFISNDQSNILQFAGYPSSTNFRPQYRYNTPSDGVPYIVSDAVKYNSSRWSSQAGSRINF